MTLREQLEEIYRDAYAVGYAAGRLAQMKDAEWDAAVPWEKETKEEAAD